MFPERRFDRLRINRYYRGVNSHRQAADAYRRHAGSAGAPRDSDDRKRQSEASSGRFLKTGINAEDLQELGGVDRAAKLLILLGAERASKVLAKLEPSEVERLAAAVMRTPRVRASESLGLLEKVGEGAVAPARAGGPEVARRMLVQAFGEEDGERIFFRSVPHAAARHFQFLEEVEPHQLVGLLKEESPAAIAVILTHISAEKAGRVVESIGPERARDVIRRIGRMQRLDRDVVLRIEDALRSKIRRQGRHVTQTVEGPSTLAAILRGMSAAQERTVLEAIALTDPELSRVVTEQLYTAEIVHRIDPRGLQDLLRDFDESELATVLKGKDEEFRGAVLRSVSERRRSMITEEYQRLGPQPRSEVDEATREFVNHVRRLVEEGRVLVRSEDDHYT